MASRKHWNYGTKDDEEFDRVNTVIGETLRSLRRDEPSTAGGAPDFGLLCSSNSVIPTPIESPPEWT